MKEHSQVPPPNLIAGVSVRTVRPVHSFPTFYTNLGVFLKFFVSMQCLMAQNKLHFSHLHFFAFHVFVGSNFVNEGDIGDQVHSLAPHNLPFDPLQVQVCHIELWLKPTQRVLQASPVSSDLFFSAEDTTGGQDKCQIVNIPANRWKSKYKTWHNHTSHCGQVQMQCGILLAPPSASNPPPHFLPPRTWIDTRRSGWG